jgi:hypothetical protein
LVTLLGLVGKPPLIYPEPNSILESNRKISAYFK